MAATGLERAIGTVLRIGVTASSVLLACGAVLFFFSAGPTATALLQAGIVILLATPVARVVVSVVEYIGDRDWTFTALTAIVLLELLASVVAALVFHRKL
ncbi:MAG TPA: DUF1634 domain-containing protein [Vicinamibacterales bacterium]|nr:DUF1634 domain-containing protein [Vicinamibacterales bacterium]